MATIETYEKITLDMLSVDSVSVLKQTFADVDGVPNQVGSNHRKSYANSEEGRELIASELPEPYLSTVMTLWGDAPTVVDQNPLPIPEEPAIEVPDDHPQE